MRTVIRSKGVEFYPNLNLNADLRNSGQLDPALRQFSSLVALRARELALKLAFDTGDYFSSIRSEVGDKSGPRGRGSTGRLLRSQRAAVASAGIARQTRSGAGLRVGRVLATDFKAHWVEYGWHQSSHGRLTGVVIPGDRVLRKAVRGSGLRYRAPKGRAERLA